MNQPAVYVWRKYHPERHLQPCVITARGRGPGPRNLRIVFADGVTMCVPWRSVRVQKGENRG